MERRGEKRNGEEKRGEERRKETGKKERKKDTRETFTTGSTEKQMHNPNINQNWLIQFPTVCFLWLLSFCSLEPISLYVISRMGGIGKYS